jgi:hypothetical protein
MKSRLAPPLSLFVLTPLIAEYLLGSLSFSKEGLAALPVVCLMYGGGAVLIREAARATRRGWPGIVILGLAYALVEEGLTTQSLFNSHYLHLRLLDYGFIPALGIGANWTVYVISLHVIWSVCVPIALVESLYPQREPSPWLGKVGWSVFSALLALGAAAVAAFTSKSEHFRATAAELITIVSLIAGLLVLGLRPQGHRPPPQQTTEAAPPHPWLLVGFALLLGSLFSLTQALREHGVPWLVPVLGIFAVVTTAVLTIKRWSSRSGWSLRQRFALGAGGVLVYCWFGYSVEVSLHGRSGLVPHTLLVLSALGLLLVAHYRVAVHERITAAGAAAAPVDTPPLPTSS